jgi:hypothetical protein
MSVLARANVPGNDDPHRIANLPGRAVAERSPAAV